MGRRTPHDLRHTAASLAIHGGGNPKVVQRMLGHASAAMTLDTYAALFDSDMASVAESVGKMWDREVDVPRATHTTGLLGAAPLTRRSPTPAQHPDR